MVEGARVRSTTGAAAWPVLPIMPIRSRPVITPRQLGACRVEIVEYGAGRAGAAGHPPR